MYYLDFPQHLMEFVSLNSVYEAEAIVWFHGIYMMTCMCSSAVSGGPIASHALQDAKHGKCSFKRVLTIDFLDGSSDILHILTHPDLCGTKEFYCAFEHALLLGEVGNDSHIPFAIMTFFTYVNQVLPYLFCLDRNLRTLGAATLQFLLISTSVVSSAIWQFHSAFASGDTMATVVSPDIPEALLVSVTSYEMVLKAMQQPNSRFGNIALQATSQILTSLTSGLNTETIRLVEECILGLTNSWIDRPGTVRLPSSMRSRSSVGEAHIDRIGGLPIANEAAAASRRAAIKALCSPDVRVSKPGCFDISIQF